MPITRLSVDGYGARRAGSFAGKVGTEAVLLVVEVDYHDGEEQRKKYKEAQQRRRKQIEEAVDTLFADPIALEEAKPILKAYSVTKPNKPIQKKDIDLDKFSLNQENLDWLNGILEERADEERMLITYLMSRH